MKKNILMICYYYPPLTDVGCKRSVAFSKYFKKHGWNPFVLSVKNPDRAYCSLGTDRPPEGVHTEYSYSLVNLYRFFGRINGLLSRFLGLFEIELRRNHFYDLFCIPDFFWGWIPLTVAKAARIIRREAIDIIYVSCTPFSSAVVGVILKLLSGKPLIIDFRDVYVLDMSGLKKNVGPPRLRRRLDRLIERNLLKHADIFVVVTEEMKELYLTHYPKMRQKIFAIHNGFDSPWLGMDRSNSKYERFTIVYAGEFYLYGLDSEVFFEALARLKKRGKINKDSFQFAFYGDDRENVAAMSKKHQIEDMVLVSARIPYPDMLNVISKSHLQLIRILPLAVPTKIFDGICMNIPFLATIPRGEAEGIIRGYSPSSYIITEEDPEAVGMAILNAMEDYRNNAIRPNRVHEFLGSFSRETLTIRLMKILEEKLG